MPKTKLYEVPVTVFIRATSKAEARSIATHVEALLEIRELTAALSAVEEMFAPPVGRISIVEECE